MLKSNTYLKNIFTKQHANIEAGNNPKNVNNTDRIKILPIFINIITLCTTYINYSTSSLFHIKFRITTKFNRIHICTMSMLRRCVWISWKNMIIIINVSISKTIKNILVFLWIQRNLFFLI
jgi:hypothetical protein